MLVVFGVVGRRLASLLAEEDAAVEEEQVTVLSLKEINIFDVGDQPYSVFGSSS